MGSFYRSEDKELGKKSGYSNSYRQKLIPKNKSKSKSSSSTLDSGDVPREIERVQDQIEVESRDVVEDNSGSNEESLAFKSSLEDILSSIKDYIKPPSRDDFIYDIGYWCVRNKVPHQWVDKLLPVLMA